MIHIDFGETDGRMTFTWSCDTCRVDDQAIRPDEGFDTIAWHLRHHHTGPNLQDLTARMSKALAGIPPEYWPGEYKPTFDIEAPRRRDDRVVTETPGD